jgi:hypothetical protein
MENKKDQHRHSLVTNEERKKLLKCVSIVDNQRNNP